MIGVVRSDEYRHALDFMHLSDLVRVVAKVREPDPALVEQCRRARWVLDRDRPAGHHIVIVATDTPVGVSGLFRAVCSCGRYRSKNPTRHGWAVRSGKQHAAACHR